MKSTRQSLTGRFALVSALLIVSAFAISLFVTYQYNMKDVLASCISNSGHIAKWTQTALDESDYENLFDSPSHKEYLHFTDELRMVCDAFDAENILLTSLDSETGEESVLAVVASDPDDEAILRERNVFGYTLANPMNDLKKRAYAGEAVNDASMFETNNRSLLCWYRHVDMPGSTYNAVLTITFDISWLYKTVFGNTLSFAVPMAIMLLIIQVVELVLLRGYVVSPIQALSKRLRNFVMDGGVAYESPDIRRKDEIGEIATSFNQMALDIGNYVTQIEDMTEERVTAGAELEVARRIQLGLVPPATSLLADGFEAYAIERTARAVGGDFYDLMVCDNGSLALIIADVSGKGISAALFMAMFRTLLHEKLVGRMNPARALNETNDIVVSNNPENMFVTAIAGIFDPVTGVLTYANAGHTPPVLVGGDYLQPDVGIALGLFEDAGIVNETIALAPGDGVLFYTDGATEAIDKDKRFFGEERLRAAVAKRCGAKEAVVNVVDSLDEFTADTEQFDDLTLLALCARESAEPATQPGQPAVQPGQPAEQVEAAGHAERWQKRIVPDLSAFGEVREAVLLCCGREALGKQVLLACDELFANVVSYSGASYVDFDIQHTEGQATVRIADDGVPFDPTAPRDSMREFEDLDLGGMGIMLVLEACSEATYERADDTNVLTLLFLEGDE